MISAEDFLRNHDTVIHEFHDEATVSRHGVEHPAAAGKSRDAQQHQHAVRQGSFRIAQAADPTDPDACREAALRLLDAAARPTGALRTKLAERGYQADVIDATVHRLVELQLVDDEAYAHQVVRSCAARHRGQRGTVMELIRKGVGRQLAERTAAQAARNGLFDDAIWELGRRMARKTRGLDAQVRRRRFWSAAGRRGHDPQLIREVYDALFDEQDEDYPDS